MSGWFAYFTLCASVGIFSVLAFLPVKPIGKGYFRTIGYIALGMGSTTLILRQFNAFTCLRSMRPNGEFHPTREAFESVYLTSEIFNLPQAAMTAGSAFLTCLFLHPFCYSNFGPWPPRIVRGVGTAAGMTLIIQIAIGLALSGYVGPKCWSLGLASTAAILGLSTDSMLLGHWYLNAPNLSFDYLKRCSLALILALALRGVVTLAVMRMSFYNPRFLVFSPSPLDLFQDPLMKVLLGARILVGTITPLILAILAWRCARIHSNQSATGILYVVLFFVIVGEMIGAYLLGTTGLPL